jgi:hypothetical protein
MTLTFTDHLGRSCGEYALPDPEHRFWGLPLGAWMISGRVWEIMRPFGYRVDTVPGLVDQWITVPAGTRTDFASIPRLAWLLIGPPAGNGDGAEYGVAAVIHDVLCVRAHSGEIERWRADAVLWSTARWRPGGRGSCGWRCDLREYSASGRRHAAGGFTLTGQPNQHVRRPLLFTRLLSQFVQHVKSYLQPFYFMADLIL